MPDPGKDLTMKYPLSLLTLSVAALCAPVAHAKDASPAAAAASTPARTAQQQRMKDCNAQAKADGKKGSDRKAFMKECLSNKK